MWGLGRDADARTMRPLHRALSAGAVAAAAAAALAAPAAASPGRDPLLGRQWALAGDGLLGAPAAWRESTGDGALVAVLDTGADLAHPDLRGALWTNPGEIPGNGVDDDHDGYVDDVHGVDVIGSDGEPADDEGHGTHVAGIIAARAGNGRGGAGLAPSARLMIVKVLDAHRRGTTAQLAAGIRYAVAHGARILNLSVNGDVPSPAVLAAIRAAEAAGAVVVASAGNDARDTDLRPSYPAGYPEPGVLGVAATGADGELAPFSNRGAGTVDVAAPGINILSTARGGGYELRSGTSMAAPFVSATLALMESARPDLGVPELARELLGSARRPAGVAGLLAAGTLDAAAALRTAVGSVRWRSSQRPLVVRLRGATRARRGAVLRWTLAGNAGAVAHMRLSLDGRTVAEVAPRTRSHLVRARPGRHRWRVLALDASGRRLAARSATLRVRRG